MKTTRAALTLGLAGLLTVLTACGGGNERSGDPTPAAQAGTASTTTTSTSAPTDTVATTTTTTSPAAGVAVAEAGLSVFEGYNGQPHGTAGAVLTNDGADETFFEVVFTFEDESGAPVGTTTTHVPHIDAGATTYAAIESLQLQGPAVAVEVTPIIRDRSFARWTGVSLPITVTNIAPRPYSGLQITGTATNPTSEIVDQAKVTCVVRAGGVIVGGMYTFLDTMPPGADAAWDITMLNDSVTFDAADCAAGFYE